MDFLNDKIIKVVPKALGNADSKMPAVVYFQKLSARGMSKYITTLKDKEIKADADLFCIIVDKVENFFLIDPDNGERKELKTPEEVVDIPGITPLIQEVIEEFGKVNIFQGESKDAR